MFPNREGGENLGRKAHSYPCHQQVKVAQSLYSIEIDFYIPEGKKQIVKLYDFSRSNRERSLLGLFLSSQAFPYSIGNIPALTVL